MSEQIKRDLEKLKPSVKRVGPLKLPVILPKGSSSGNPDRTYVFKVRGDKGTPDEKVGVVIAENVDQAVEMLRDEWPHIEWEDTAYASHDTGYPNVVLLRSMWR